MISLRLKQALKSWFAIMEDMTTGNKPFEGPAALEARSDEIKHHQSQVASRRSNWILKNAYFYGEILRLVKFIIEPGRRVLNLRCQTGFMLDAVKPVRGVGVEITEDMVSIARESFPNYEYRVESLEALKIDEQFDYILFDSVSDTVDVLKALSRIKKSCNSSSRLVIYTYNHIWQPILSLAEQIGLKMSLPEQNWLSKNDLYNMLELTGFEPLKTYSTILVPKYIPFVSRFLNRFVGRLPIIEKLCMIQAVVARPMPKKIDENEIGISIIIPCKNEVGNIESAVKRIPKLGKHTEIIFCDDKSTDGTAEKVKELQVLYPDKDIKLVEGPGICKSRNVWEGFDAATQDVLMILDADLTVMPEELPYFLKAIAEGKGELINGVRLVYPIPKYAMRFSNMLGNKVFSLLFSFLLRQRIKDTLCGTKVIWREDWPKIKRYIGTWGVEDHWGDYDLLFGAARSHLRIVDLPIHYQERVFGHTKMVRVFHNGVRMMKMFLAAFSKLKMNY